MTKTIQLSNERYERLIAAAVDRGFVVKPGPGSELGKFIEWLLEAAPPPIGGDTPPEVWRQFAVAVTPLINELGLALARLGKGVRPSVSAEQGQVVIEQYDF